MAVIKRGNRFRGMTRDQDGNQISKSFSTRREAEAWAKGFKIPGTDRIARPESHSSYRSQDHGSQTVAAYAETWLDSHKLEAGSRITYRHILSAHVLPGIGSMAIKKITRADIRAWFRKLDDAGLSGALIAKIKTVASAIFQTALDDDLITVNPVRGIKT